MTSAQTIFVIYGLVILTYGFVLGVPLAASRLKAPQAPRHLVTTHLSGLIQEAIPGAIPSSHLSPVQLNKIRDLLRTETRNQPLRINEPLLSLVDGRFRSHTIEHTFPL